MSRDRPGDGVQVVGGSNPPWPTTPIFTRAYFRSSLRRRVQMGGFGLVSVERLLRITPQGLSLRNGARCA